MPFHLPLLTLSLKEFDSCSSAFSDTSGSFSNFSTSHFRQNQHEASGGEGGYLDNNDDDYYYYYLTQHCGTDESNGTGNLTALSHKGKRASLSPNGRACGLGRQLLSIAP
eukprot:5652290-Amphidinium_carterae.1